MPEPTTYTDAQVVAVLNRAADEICEAAELPDTGTRDALNLLVNAALHYLSTPGDSLADVVRENYDLDAETLEDREPLEVIMDWINY